MRNLLNRRNVKRDISGKFNEAIDFFELAVTGYIIAAAMHYFGMKSTTHKPTRNYLQPLHHSALRIVDEYVVVHESSHDHKVGSNDMTNPHAERIALEHSYAKPTASSCTSSTPQVKKRKLPEWLLTHQDRPRASRLVKKVAQDGVFNYSSAVLNDGLLLLELRDAVREGDGLRVVRCWKFMLLYWRYAGHTKYALEALRLLGAVNGTATLRTAEEITWCRFVNSRGGPGNNIPVDLFMEHLNRTLKEYLHGLGANVNESTIVHISKSLKALMDTCSHFDSICGIHNESIYHTCQDTSKDLDLIVQELVKSDVFEYVVFEYVPGRFHKTFQNIKPHIAAHIDCDKMFNWIKDHQKKISNHMKLRELLHKK